MQASAPSRDRRIFLAASLALTTATLLPRIAQAQPTTWPGKPIRLVVNFPPNSSPDALARKTSLPLQQALG